MTKVSNFEKVLDSVEALSVDEQETLILYEKCVYETKVQQCDRSFTEEIIQE